MSARIQGIFCTAQIFLYHSVPKGLSQGMEKNFRDTGARLRSIRTSFTGLPIKAFAKAIKVNPAAYYSWESGHRRIGIDAAIAVRDGCGLTLDFIFLGEKSGLSDEAMKTLKRGRPLLPGERLMHPNDPE